MGSYLVLNGNENNSKAISGMMISIIRDIESNNKNEKWFKPDYYNEDNIGCGDWIIHRKALAKICEYTKRIIEDDEWIENYTYLNHEWHEFNGIRINIMKNG